MSGRFEDNDGASGCSGRGFCRREVLVLGSAAVVQLQTGCAILRGGASHPAYERPEAQRSGAAWSIPASDLASIPAGDALLLRPGDPYPELLVTRRQDGSYLVATADCRHQGCTVDWNAQASEWQCPCHGSRYASDGRVVEGPADEPLIVSEMRLEGDALTIDLDRFKSS